MTKVSSYLQVAFPLCGELILGQTKIHRVPLDQVTVGHGAHIAVSNNRHAGKPSSAEQMRKCCDTLLDKQLDYHLLTLNCEHFATFVRYGRAVCNQVGALSIWYLLRKKCCLANKKPQIVLVFLRIYTHLKMSTSSLAMHVII